MGGDLFVPTHLLGSATYSRQRLLTFERHLQAVRAPVCCCNSLCVGDAPAATSGGGSGGPLLHSRAAKRQSRQAAHGHRYVLSCGQGREERCQKVGSQAAAGG